MGYYCIICKWPTKWHILVKPEHSRSLDRYPNIDFLCSMKWWKIYSDTGTRTPVTNVRGPCDNHLHYIGFVDATIEINYYNPQKCEHLFFSLSSYNTYFSSAVGSFFTSISWINQHPIHLVWAHHAICFECLIFILFTKIWLCNLTSWPSSLRRCVKAAVFLAWVRIPPKSLFDWESLPGRGGGIFSMGFIDHPISHPGPWGRRI